MSTLSKSAVLRVISSWPPAGRYLVACSGGMDSCVLLHLMHALRDPLPGRLLAVHVDHGISDHRKKWAEQCTGVCRDLDVELIQLRVDARPVRGHSPEDLARRLRYSALRELMAPDDMLVTAHHADDQAETLLLQLCRGAGPAGLAAMPDLRRFEPGWHGRPLLEFARDQVHAYARANALDWSEDDSNVDCRYDRNFLRHEIMPGLRSRWPSLARTLCRAAEHQAAAAALLTELAELDMVPAMDSGAGTLQISALTSLGAVRRDNLLRHWISSRHLPLPDTAQLTRVWAEVVCARPDAMPCVSWPGAEIRRHRDRLYALAPLAEHERGRVLTWDLNVPLATALGELTAAAGRGSGIRASVCAQGRVEVRYRIGGERLRPHGSAHRRTLKALLQEEGVPAWLRDRIPLVFIGGRLAAVADRWIDEDYAASSGEEAWVIRWSGTY